GTRVRRAPSPCRHPAAGGGRRVAIMLNILSAAHIDVLERFAEGNVLLAFEYDGTLAPGGGHAHARMRPGTRLIRTPPARRYPCIIISDRSRRDLADRIRSVPIWQAVTIRPNRAAERRAAVEHARRLLACDSAIYVGDDAVAEQHVGAGGLLAI